MDEVVLVEPSLEYKDDVMSFLEEVRVADEGMHWQYAGMSRLEKSNTYEEWLQEKEDEEKRRGKEKEDMRKRDKKKKR